VVHRAHFELAGGQVGWTISKVTQLAAPLNAVNEAHEPTRVIPRDARASVEFSSGDRGRLAATFPAHSVTTIELVAR
jgi:hypothetical protein